VSTPTATWRERLFALAAMVPVALVTFGTYQVINWSFVHL
jgi:hypothetical protein